MFATAQLLEFDGTERGRREMRLPLFLRSLLEWDLERWAELSAPLIPPECYPRARDRTEDEGGALMELANVIESRRGVVEVCQVAKVPEMMKCLRELRSVPEQTMIRKAGRALLIGIDCWRHDSTRLQFSLRDRKNERHLNIFCDYMWCVSPRELQIGIRNLQFVVSSKRSDSKANTKLRQGPLQGFHRSGFTPETLQIQIEPAKEIPGLECKKHWPTVNDGYAYLPKYVLRDDLGSVAGAEAGRIPWLRSRKMHPVHQAYATTSRRNFGKAAEWTWKHRPLTRHDSIQPGVAIKLETLWSVWRIPLESDTIQELQFKMTLTSTPRRTRLKLFDRAGSNLLEGPPQYFSLPLV